MRIKNHWNVYGKIIGILASYENDETLPIPGDYISDGNNNFLVLSVKKQDTLIKLEVISETGEKISSERINTIRSRPSSGSFYVIGNLHPWALASLRYIGFEVTEYPEESDIIILSSPTRVQGVSREKRIIIAPEISLNLDNLMKFNKYFSEEGIKIRFDFRKPVMPQKSMGIVPLMGGQIALPQDIILYPLITDEFPICFINSSIIGVFSPEKNVVVLSSQALLIIYDLILSKGDNASFLKWLMQFNIRVEETESSEHVIERSSDIGEIIINYGNLPADQVFNHVLYKFSIYGGIINKKDEITRTAEVTFVSGEKTTISVKLKIERDYIKLTPSVRDIVLIGVLRSIIIDSIRELNERKKQIENFRRIIDLSLNIQFELITLKDAIEAELSQDLIREQIDKIIRIAASDEKFRDIAETLKNYSDKGTLSPTIANELLRKLREIAIKECC